MHLRTAAAIELRMQKHSPLFALGHYPVDRSKVFRRSTDPVSPDAQRVLDVARGPSAPSSTYATG